MKERREPDGTPGWSLAVALRQGEAGPQLAVEPVTDADLAEHRAEAWFAGCLRKGRRELPMNQVPMRIVPEMTTAGRCAGFHVETIHPLGRPTRHRFTTRSLKEVATRGAERLVTEGVLSAQEACYFELVAQPAAARPERAVEGGITFTSREAPLRFLSVPLRDLLARAVRVGPDLEGVSPVFYTREAFDLAERFARRGAAGNPPRETGAVLIGPLCACPETGEVFTVVTLVVEVVEAEEEEFSLSYTGRSWTRIQSVLRALRSSVPTRSWRLLGQSHGHNFLPRDGGQPCESCPHLAECHRTSVFVSEADQKWSRAVFSRQPWHLCHIFGLSARAEHVSGLFGQRDGRLQERPFFVIPEFDPGQWQEV